MVSDLALSVKDESLILFQCSNQSPCLHSCSGVGMKMQNSMTEKHQPLQVKKQPRIQLHTQPSFPALAI